MITITSSVKTSDLLRWVRALRNIEKRAAYWLVANGGELNKQCAISYAGKVLVALESEEFAMSYRKYTSRYAEWKKRVGVDGHGFWDLKSDLARALTYFREEDGWKGGIPDDAMDTGGKSWLGNLDKGPIKPIAMYGIVSEFGGEYGRGGTHPGRPLFWPVYQRFESVLLDIHHGKMLTDLESYWS